MAQKDSELSKFLTDAYANGHIIPNGRSSSIGDEVINVQRLCQDSLGTNFYLNALQLKSRKDDRGAALLFDAATDCLEDELKVTKPNSPERRRLLEKLYDCYQALSVEASLPSGRRANLQLSWVDYIKRTSQINKELEGYQQ